MNGGRSAFRIVLVSILLIVGLPVLGWWARRNGPPRCEFDGLEVVPTFAVRVTDRAGESHSFCCVRCAQRWLARAGETPASVAVTDEITGSEFDSRAAVFVRSPVVTNRVTGNRVHVFRTTTDADAHIGEFGGRVLSAGECPLEVPK